MGCLGCWEVERIVDATKCLYNCGNVGFSLTINNSSKPPPPPLYTPSPFPLLEVGRATILHTPT